MKKTPAELRAQQTELADLISKVHYNFGQLMTDVSHVSEATIARLHRFGFFPMLATISRSLGAITEWNRVSDRITAARTAQSRIDVCVRQLSATVANLTVAN